MVTKVGERGQVGIRGASVTDEWEQLVKFAAKRQGTTFADFIVDVTRTAALAIVKHRRQTLPTTRRRRREAAGSVVDTPGQDRGCRRQPARAVCQVCDRAG